ncbi:hypothetical protein GALMADRAFT_156095 [Galerina marginata CBS 339.88]|uniref:Uncharacterized protein n=1 Tax=Galerina marginata (strain CBS 339.88) TaxID=685588 RepID=A0A067T080_GALM3|nr:hypothetical protein GALMADRAFT_156095 [Galerina marginata CBS 339.88]
MSCPTDSVLFSPAQPEVWTWYDATMGAYQQEAAHVPNDLQAGHIPDFWHFGDAPPLQTMIGSACDWLYDPSVANSPSLALLPALNPRFITKVDQTYHDLIDPFVSSKWSPSSSTTSAGDIDLDDWILPSLYADTNALATEIATMPCCISDPWPQISPPPPRTSCHDGRSRCSVIQTGEMETPNQHLFNQQPETGYNTCSEFELVERDLKDALHTDRSRSVRGSRLSRSRANISNAKASGPERRASADSEDTFLHGGEYISSSINILGPIEAIYSATAMAILSDSLGPGIGIKEKKALRTSRGSRVFSPTSKTKEIAAEASR